jgi:hypothetical protein
MATIMESSVRSEKKVYLAIAKGTVVRKRQSSLKSRETSPKPFEF